MATAGQIMSPARLPSGLKGCHSTWIINDVLGVFIRSTSGHSGCGYVDMIYVTGPWSSGYKTAFWLRASSVRLWLNFMQSRLDFRSLGQGPPPILAAKAFSKPKTNFSWSKWSIYSSSRAALLRGGGSLRLISKAIATFPLCFWWPSLLNSRCDRRVVTFCDLTNASLGAGATNELKLRCFLAANHKCCGRKSSFGFALRNFTTQKQYSIFRP